jgi:hypothetical protein
MLLALGATYDLHSLAKHVADCRLLETQTRCAMSRLGHFRRSTRHTDIIQGRSNEPMQARKPGILRCMVKSIRQSQCISQLVMVN